MLDFEVSKESTSARKHRLGHLSGRELSPINRQSRRRATADDCARFTSDGFFVGGATLQRFNAAEPAFAQGYGAAGEAKPILKALVSASALA